MRDKYIQALQSGKGRAVAYYHANDEDQWFWEQAIEDYDDEIIEQSKVEPMYGKARIGVMIIIVLILATVALSGCQTVKGSLGDLSWGAKVLADNIVVQEK